MKKIFLILILFLCTLNLYAITSNEIIKRVEKNQITKTSHYTAILIINDRFGSRRKTLEAFTSGRNKTLIEFTNPEELGQKILIIDNEIYLYFPDAEEIIHLQGNALRDSVLGSDFSYEDLAGEEGYFKKYNSEFLKTVKIDNTKCYLLKLTAKKRGMTYPIQKIWVDAELFVLRKAEYYSLSERLLKELFVKEIKRISGKFIPVNIEIRDRLKKHSSTQSKIEEIQIDIPIKPDTFSLEELTW